MNSKYLILRRQRQREKQFLKISYLYSKYNERYIRFKINMAKHYLIFQFLKLNLGH
jgi:hypothetical protein